MLNASSGVAPEVLVVVAFVGRPLRFFEGMAWFAVSRGIGPDVDMLPLFRDVRLFGPSTGRSDVVVG